MTYPDGKTAKYFYDDMNRLIKVKGADNRVTKYAYDELGRRILTKGPKVDASYEYDNVGNLVAQTSTGAYDVSLAYTYDKAGRITNESRTENGTTQENSYIYDAIGQLKQWNDEHYSYDAVGNMLTKGNIKYTYNAGNQLVSDGVDKYAYDRNGNLTQKGDVRYTYNARNLLESYASDEYSESYTYNAFGLLSSIQQNNVTTTLTWDILNGDGVVIIAAKNGEVTDYTYGIERISAQTKGNRTEYVTDITGSVIAEISSKFLNTEVTTKAYTPFGETESSGFGFKGEYYNADTGMIYLRARFYAPEMNRFSQKDILKGSVTDALSLNRYLYCQNDPVNFIDPSGMATRATSSSKAIPVTTSKTASKSASSIASSTGKKVTDGGNSQREAAIYGKNTAVTPKYSDGGNNQREQTIYNNTYTPTPSYSQAYQPPIVGYGMTGNAMNDVMNGYNAAACKGGKATVVNVDIRALGAGDYATSDKEGHYTVALGVTGSYAYLIGGAQSIGHAWDAQGNDAYYVTTGTKDSNGMISGIGTPSVGASANITFSNAPSIELLAGESIAIGGSYKNLGIEINTFSDPATNNKYNSITISLAESYPEADVHYYEERTVLYDKEAAKLELISLAEKVLSIIQ